MSRFKSDCENLPITITPNFHIVFHHIDQFIEGNTEYFEIIKLVKSVNLKRKNSANSA